MLIPLRDSTRAETAPLLTLILIGVNTTIFLFSTFQGVLGALVDRFGFTPNAALAKPEIIITSTFLHAGILHLASNMWFLWLYGDNIEDRFGRAPFLGLYLASGVAGNVAQALFTGLQSIVPVIGASGAVAGVMGAYLICYPRARVKTLFILVFYPLFFQLPALLLLSAWMVGEFWMAIVAQPGDFVAHWAHVGGFVTGAIWGWKKRHPLHRPRGWWW